jgi:hypothetical protein
MPKEKKKKENGLMVKELDGWMKILKRNEKRRIKKN